MKKTRIVLVGALVLALTLVMGCGSEPKLDESVDGHNEGKDKFTHEWKATYPDGKTYIRSALQFGDNKAADKITKLDAAITTLYPQNGKAGLIFGLTTNEGPEDANGNKTYTYNYYVFGVGEKPNDTKGTLDYYIDWCTNVKTLSGGNTPDESIDKSGGAASTSIAAGELTDSTHKAKEAYEFTVSISFADADTNDDCDGTYTLVVKEGNRTVLTKEIDHKTYGHVDGIATYHALGTVASYGMVSGAVSGEKKVSTTWVLDKNTLEGAGLKGATLSVE